jgi:hypothetical protein
MPDVESAQVKQDFRVRAGQEQLKKTSHKEEYRHSLGAETYNLWGRGTLEAREKKFP